ncbi:MAG: alpha/beta fold hydrolase [Rhodospirillales bacterium]|nr:alpha/beta fold hydrolase [Rhodospirillales bacterium]MBO6787503.1 alpha/beta fold hydrolase [Rhodospirillales bacterium]
MPAVPLSITDLGAGTPLLILHGLFGRKRNWQAIQKRLADDIRIVTADMRNHGDSPWDDEMTYPAMAGDLAKLIRDLDAGPAVVAGHSMGGKAAMTLAMTEPELVRALMVIDIAPVAYDHTYQPYIDAMRGVPLGDLERRSQAEEYMKDAIPDPGVRAFLLQNLGQDDNRLKWQVNLDAIERGLPAILDFPAGHGAPYEGRTLFVRGGNSDFVADSHVPLIENLFPMAEHAEIADAGHWAHAEKPEEVIRIIRAFADDA